MAFPSLTDEQCREAAEASLAYPTIQAAADALGLDRMTFRHRLRKAAQGDMSFVDVVEFAAQAASVLRYQVHEYAKKR